MPSFSDWQERRKRTKNVTISFRVREEFGEDLKQEARRSKKSLTAFISDTLSERMKTLRRERSLREHEERWAIRRAADPYELPPEAKPQQPWSWVD